MKHGWFKKTVNHYVLWLDDKKMGFMKIKKSPGSKSGTPNAFSLETQMKYWRGVRGKSFPFNTRKAAQERMHAIMILHKQKYGKKLEKWHDTGEYDHTSLESKVVRGEITQRGYKLAKQREREKK